MSFYEASAEVRREMKIQGGGMIFRNLNSSTWPTLNRKKPEVIEPREDISRGAIPKINLQYDYSKVTRGNRINNTRQEERIEVDPQKRDRREEMKIKKYYDRDRVSESDNSGNIQKNISLEERLSELERKMQLTLKLVTKIMNGVLKEGDHGIEEVGKDNLARRNNVMEEHKHEDNNKTYNGSQDHALECSGMEK